MSSMYLQDLEHAFQLQAKKFESLGLPREQAEGLTRYMTEQIILDRMRLTEKFTAKVELEKVSKTLKS